MDLAPSHFNPHLKDYNPPDKKKDGKPEENKANAEDLKKVINRAIKLFDNQSQYAKVQANALTTRCSWDFAAKQYLKVTNGLPLERKLIQSDVHNFQAVFGVSSCGR